MYRIQIKKEDIEVIDLFCGIGGLTNGLIKAGLNVSKGYDIEPFFKYGYEKNNKSKFICDDIKNIKGNLFNENTKIKILVGCAPCQPFSLYTTKYKYNENNNSKWNLLKEFLRLIEENNPDIISLENVPNLKNQNLFNDFVSKLNTLKYYVNYKIVNCVDYEIPQKRKRLVLIASKYGKINLIEKSNKKPKTVREALKNLPKIKAGETYKDDFIHKTQKLSDLNIKRIQASKPGGTWRDWNENLKLACHKKLTGRSFSCVYGRMKWDEPAPTLTTKFCGYGNGRFGHPTEDRAISIREGAILQTFSPDYKFCKKEVFSLTKLSQAIGNAVPVRLGEVIGQSIIKSLKG